MSSKCRLHIIPCKGQEGLRKNFRLNRVVAFFYGEYEDIADVPVGFGLWCCLKVVGEMYYF